MTAVIRAMTLAVALLTLQCTGQGSNGDLTENPPNAGSGDAPLVTVASILADDRWVGETIRVRGRCIGYADVRALGPQPRTRSDWQLIDDDEAIWVVGAYPDGCSGTEPADDVGVYVMTVAQDTLPVLGDRPRIVRQYLVHSP